MPTAYIATLNREMGGCEDQAPSAVPDLRQQLLDWHTNLPEITRQRPFAMVELEQALSTQGKYLSPVLLNLGWQRRRRWASHGQYNRYWLPPVLNTERSAKASLECTDR